MITNIKQKISLNNKLAMTLQIKLAIKLLQLNSIELQKEIDDKILTNPFLESDVSSEILYSTRDNIYDSKKTNNAESIDGYEQLAQPHQTLREYLMWQISMSSINQSDELIAYNLIDYISDSGYLTESLENIFILLNKSMDISFQEIFAVLHKIQHLDPIGSGATSLKDCLLIQLEHYHLDDKLYVEAKKIINKLDDAINPKLSTINNFFAELEKKDYNKDCIKIIKSLNPKPGNIIDESLEHEQIIPDVIVSFKDNKWVTELNPNINPKIRINKEYEALAKKITSKKDIEYVKSNLQDAKFFLKALQNRNVTILKVGKTIIKKQINFLNKGESAMLPLRLKDIAQKIGMHESTVSRCTNKKYIQTPRGVYEMKYFFSSEIKTKFGAMASSTSVKSLLKDIIAKENPKSPLSDIQIADSLSKNGFKIARRTITKYRESLSIPPSNERKNLAK